MKTIISLIFTFFIAANCFAQGNLFIVYEAVKNNQMMTTNLRGELLITKEKSYYKINFNEKNSIEKEANEEIVIINMGDDQTPNLDQILIEKTLDKLTHYYYDSSLKNHYAIQENLPKIQWKIEEETKSIGNYTCRKATTSFRGRNYTVWFTPEIPLPYGPWKLNGLPGLILEAYDDTGTYSWMVKSIQPNTSQTIITADTNTNIVFERISFKAHDEKYVALQIQRFKAMMTRNTDRDSPYKTSFIFSTAERKEPTNEWRKKSEFIIE
ncbi:MAG: GLPGLI family protein [Flavobacteriaceae bacterium]|nr:GLPGLI family protein [Flavobacteriaceae bacterium]